MGADMLHVGDEIPCGIFAQFGMGRGAAAAALVEQDDTIAFRVVQAAHGGRYAAAGPAMDHDDGFAVRIAALLDMNAVQEDTCNISSLKGSISG